MSTINSNFVVKNGLVVNGTFTANSTVVNATGASVSANTISLTSSVAVGSNVTVNTTTIAVGTATINSTFFRAGNSTSNITFTSGDLSINGVNVNTMISGNASTSYSNAIAFSSNATNLTNGTVPAARLSGNYNISANNANNLGGNAPSFYTNATNITTGTLNTARLPATVNVSSDVNVGANVNLTTAQISVGNSTVNVVINSTAVSVSSDPLVQQSDIGTAPDQVPLNQYLGSLAYQSDTIAVSNTFNIGGAAYFTANGNVGVGNSSPAHKLRVDGDVSLSGAIEANGSFGSAGQTLHSNGTGVYWSSDDEGVTSVASGSGLTGGPITTTGTLSVLANNGIIANATGVFVNANTGLVANATGLHINANTGLVANATGVHVNTAFIGTLTANNATNLGGQPASFYTNATNLTTGTVATARLGSGTANSTTFLAGDQSYKTAVTSVTSGSGLTGTVTTAGSLSVLANTGLVANATGVYVNANTGLVANATGVHVNSTFIGTLTANNTTNFNGQPASFYTNATNLATGTVPTARLGSGTANSTTFLGGDQSYKTAVTSITGGSGLTGTVTTTGSLSVLANTGLIANATGLHVGVGNGISANLTAVSVLANSGIIANATGVYVNANTGLVANATGVHVNTAFIGTLTANNSTNFDGLSLATVQSQITGNAATAYTNAITVAANATNLTSGTVNNARLPAAIAVTTVNAATLSVGSIVVANSTGLTTSANVVIGSAGELVLTAGAGIFANGSLGTAGQVLSSNGSSVYWGTGGDVTANSTTTFTNKRINPRVSSTATATSVTPDIGSFDVYAYTALASGLTINATTGGTPVDGNRLVFRFKDNGTARALTWVTSGSNSFRAVGVTLPTTTVINKVTYVGCVYNAAESFWDVLAVVTQA